MPRFNNESRKQRIKELLLAIECGDYVAKRDFEIAIGRTYAKQYKELWANQLELRKVEIPQAVKDYERMLQDAIMWHGRLDAYSGRKSSSTKLIVNRFQVGSELKNKVDGLFERAYIKLQEIVSTDKSLIIWFDRDIDFSFDSNISIDCDGMPRVITSKSPNNLAKGKLEQMFGWQTKSDLKLLLLQKALLDLDGDATTNESTKVDSRKLKEMLGKLRENND